MPSSRFIHYELRTLDPDAARAFYTDIFGAEFWGSELSCTHLPERAIARGAPAHWLGQIGVDDVEASTAQMLAAGAERLGAAPPNTDGPAPAVLRDPFGAVVALRARAQVTPRAPVVFHVLNTTDQKGAFACYAALCGWSATESVDLRPGRGRHQFFAWDDSGRNAGSVADTARLPNVHPHWLFCFRVADLDAARSRIRALGGLALEPSETASGDRIAACDDPQGAAFGLYQYARR